MANDDTTAPSTDPSMATAVRVHETGGPEQLVTETIELPAPGPREVVVTVHATGVNFIDTYHRSGLYEMPLPFTLGSEGSGIVAAIGSDVTTVAPGDHVAWVGVAGSYASHVVAPEDLLLSLPGEISLDIAAAMPLQGMTAHYLISDTYRLGPGDRCLIHAAAGGTGRLMVQMAKRRGAEVVATVGSDAKAELARSAGADHVILYRDVDLVDAVEAAVGPDAIDVVYDGVGAATFDAGLRVLRPRGTMATFGNASGAVPPISPLALSAKSLFLTRPTLWNYISTPAARASRWDELVGWVRNGELEVRVGHTFALADAADAHRALEGRGTTGKILLVS